MGGTTHEAIRWIVLVGPLQLSCQGRFDCNLMKIYGIAYMFVEEGMIGLYCSHVMLVWINWRYGPVVYLWVLYSMRRIGFILRRVINTDSRGFI